MKTKSQVLIRSASKNLLLALLVLPLMSPIAQARNADTDPGGSSPLEESISKVVQYSKASGSGSGVVLAQNAKGEQIILTNSQNMGARFHKSVFGEFVEITDWNLDNTLVHVGSGPLARIPTIENGALKYSQSVGFYRPRPKFQDDSENVKKLLPGSDFALSLNTGRADFDLQQFNRLFHDEFEKVVEFSDVKAGDSVFAAGVSALSYPSIKPTALAGVIAGEDKIQSLLSESIYDEAGRRVLTDIAFEPAKEILVMSTEQVKGFSGGAIFDEAGRLAGVITRSGTTQSGVHFYRALKSSYIQTRLANVEFPGKIRPIIKTLLEVSNVSQACLELVPASPVQELIESAPSVEEAQEIAHEQAMIEEIDAPRIAAFAELPQSAWSRLTAKLRSVFRR